ncbi:hypothetical protein AC1031_008960 [Aphanomyces cochlioides]|nr:hypothetical protein AC1031_008960 [Aphanomyces cochlioides]
MNMKPETFVLQITSCLYLLETSSEFRLDLGEYLDLETIFQLFQLDEVPDDILDQLLPLAVACLYINAQNCEDFRYPSPSDMPSPQEDEHVAEIVAFANRLYASENWYFVRSYMPIQDSMLHYHIDDAIIRRAIPFLKLAYHAINIRVQPPTDPNEALHQERQFQRARQVLQDVEQQKLNVQVASESETPLASHEENLRDDMPNSRLTLASKEYKLLNGSRSTASTPAILTPLSQTLQNIFHRIHRQEVNVRDDASISTLTPASEQERKRILKKVTHRMHHRETKVPHLTSKDKRAAISTERLSFFDNKVSLLEASHKRQFQLKDSSSSSRMLYCDTAATNANSYSCVEYQCDQAQTSPSTASHSTYFSEQEDPFNAEFWTMNNVDDQPQAQQHLTTLTDSNQRELVSTSILPYGPPQKVESSLLAVNFDQENGNQDATMSMRPLGEATARSNMTSKLQQTPTKSLLTPATLNTSGREKQPNISTKKSQSLC